MKRSPYFLSLPALTLALLLLSACNKERILSESDAYRLIENAVVTNTEGMASQTTDIADLALAFQNTCNTTGDSAITRSGTSGQVDYNYTFAWDWSVLCNAASVPQVFSASWSSDGTYSTARFESSDNSAGGYTVTGLQPASTNLTFNGSFERQGSQFFVSGSNNRAIRSTIIMSTTNLLVSKNTQLIVDGDCDVSISGDYDGTPFSFSGTLQFLGGEAATLTLDSLSYTITW